MNVTFSTNFHSEFTDLYPRYIEFDVSNLKFPGQQKQEFILLYRMYCSYMTNCYFLVKLEEVWEEVKRISLSLPDGYKIFIGCKKCEHLNSYLPQIYIWGRTSLGDFTMYEILKTWEDGDPEYDDVVVKYKIHQPYMTKPNEEED